MNNGARNVLKPLPECPEGFDGVCVCYRMEAKKLSRMLRHANNIEGMRTSVVEEVPALLGHIPGIISIQLHYGCFVYFLLQDNEIVYVGQTTGCLESRLSFHAVRATSGNGGKIFNRAFAYSCDPSSVDAEEQKRIQEFHPKYNRAGVTRPLRKTS